MTLNRKAEKYFAANKPYAGLGRKALHSGVTFVAARGLNIFMQVASTVLLARLLSPHDFGLVAIVLALTGFGPMLIDLGTSEASTQKTVITPVETSALFWLNVAIGGALTVLLAGGSGFIASLFGEPALAGIALLSSLSFILAAISIQHYALMRRAMQFRHIAIIDISTNVIGSIVAVVMAFTEWRYWALAAKPIVTSGLAAVAVWVSCPWIPGRPRLTPEVKESIRFGIGVAGFTVTDTLSRSADRLALGYFYGAGPLGFFHNAFLIYSNLLSIVSDPLHNIAVSSLSKLRDNVDRLKGAWAVALTSVAFFSSAMFAVLAVTGQDFVAILLGQKWAPAGPLLSVIAVRGIAHSVERTMGWLHIAAGRSDRWMRWGVISAVCQLGALIAGLPFGAMGVATAYTVAVFGLFVPALVYAGRPLGIGVKDVLPVVGPQTVAGLGAVAFGLMVQRLFLLDFSHPVRFVISATACLVAYLAVAVGVFKVTGPLQIALGVLHDLHLLGSRRSS